MTSLEKEILNWLYKNQGKKEKSVEFFTNFISQAAFPCTDEEVSRTLKNLGQRQLISLTYYANGEVDVVNGITIEGLAYFIVEITKEMNRRR